MNWQFHLRFIALYLAALDRLLLDRAQDVALSCPREFALAASSFVYNGGQCPCRARRLPRRSKVSV